MAQPPEKRLVTEAALEVALPEVATQDAPGLVQFAGPNDVVVAPVGDKVVTPLDVASVISNYSANVALVPTLALDTDGQPYFIVSQDGRDPDQGDPPPPAPTPAFRLGVYSGDSSTDDAAHTLYGVYPDMAETWYGPTQQTLNVSGETARINKGIVPLIDLNTNGTTRLNGIATGVSADLTWLDQYVSALNTLSNVNTTRPVYATLHHSWEVDVNSGALAAGPSATAAVYAEALSVFFDKCKASAPLVKFGYWYAGFDTAKIDAVLSALRTAPKWIAVIGLNFHTGGSSTATPTTVWNNKLTWLRNNVNFARLGSPLVGVGETATDTAFDDTSVANFYTGLRNRLVDNQVDFAVVRQTDDPPNTWKMTAGTTPTGITRLAASLGGSYTPPTPPTTTLQMGVNFTSNNDVDETFYKDPTTHLNRAFSARIYYPNANGLSGKTWANNAVIQRAWNQGVRVFIISWRDQSTTRVDAFLASIPQSVWDTAKIYTCFNHEPEDDASKDAQSPATLAWAAQWKQQWRNQAPIMRQYGGIPTAILMAWTLDPASNRLLSDWTPPPGTVDVFAFDGYFDRFAPSTTISRIIAACNTVGIHRTGLAETGSATNDPNRVSKLASVKSLMAASPYFEFACYWNSCVRNAAGAITYDSRFDWPAANAWFS